MLDYKSFCKGLIRILILAKEKLKLKDVKKSRKKVKADMGLKQTHNIHLKEGLESEQLKEEKMRAERLKRLRIEEIRVSKKFSVEELTAEDVRDMMEFL